MRRVSIKFSQTDEVAKFVRILNRYDVEASIICEKDSHKGIVIGKGGAMLKRIGSDARREIEHMMDAKVNLQLWVKVRREWRDSELYMKNYGYNVKDL